MKKIIMSLVAMLSVQAMAESPLWNCAMEFEAKGEGLQLILGKYEVTGTGTLDCYGLNGQELSVPIKITMDSQPVNLRVAFGELYAKGVSAEIALFANSPEDLLGEYLAVRAEAAIIGGVGAFVATHAKFPALVLHVGLEFTHGFGVNLGIERMKIEVAN
ncbi:MAG: hypothetical protein IT288_07440 [Bdellovibrionales bacterium]|nr:hypothetical protein [Bdellovibrionales bacterium]